MNESDGDSSDEYHQSSSGEETDSEVEGIHPGRTVSSTATAAICKKSLISVPQTSVGTKSKSSNNNRSPTHAQCTPTTENNCFRSMQQSTLLPLHRPTASLFTPAPQSNAPLNSSCSAPILIRDHQPPSPPNSSHHHSPVQNQRTPQSTASHISSSQRENPTTPPVHLHSNEVDWQEEYQKLHKKYCMLKEKVKILEQQSGQGGGYIIIHV